MNMEYLATLPQDEQEAILEAYQQVLDNEITPPSFFSKVKDLIGARNLSQLCSTTQENEIKTDQLHDIIQYSGVDLKEEQEKINKETDHYFETDINEENFELDDYHNSIDSLLNPQLFYDFVNRIVVSRGMQISDDAYHAVFMVLKRKLLDFFEKLVTASKIRVDISRNEYQILIENDIRRQLWCLEQNEQKEMEKLKFKKDDEQKKKLKRTVQEREDLLIKKRMSNTVALAALGIKQKSWMSFGEGMNSKDVETPFHSLYSPFDEKEQEKKVSERIITMQDFVHVLEHDKRYNKSIFTIQQYYIGR
ncbi:hypothetical protein BDAP_002690 [Binucleata daphniae]